MLPSPYEDDIDRIHDTVSDIGLAVSAARRFLCLLLRAIVAVPMVIAVTATPAARSSQDTPKTVKSPNLSGLHDFDFFVGTWSTHSRRLKERCAGSHDWEQFDGTIRNYKLMNGRANVDDTEFDMPEGIYRGVAPRAYDPQRGGPSGGSMAAIRSVPWIRPSGAASLMVLGSFTPKTLCAARRSRCVSSGRT